MHIERTLYGSSYFRKDNVWSLDDDSAWRARRRVLLILHRDILFTMLRPRTARFIPEAELFNFKMLTTIDVRDINVTKELKS